MTLSVIQNAFSAGEISPSLFGRTDLAKYHLGASTMRNMFVNYRGGASSRAGLKYVGMCKQGAPNSGGTSTNNPPRDITFQFNINQGFALEFGDQYMRVKYRGAYVTELGTTITGATKANPLVITDVAHGYSNGDWIFISGMLGMTELDGLIWIVTNVTTDTYRLTDLFANVVDSSSFGAYISGGTAARIYTKTSPYAAVDLPFLKFTQSANVMSLTCVNQNTGTDYPPYDLERVTNINWAFTAVTFTASIVAPTGISVSAQSSTTTSTFYAYTVTAVNVNGEESVAGTPAGVKNNNISINAGSNTITWTPAATAVSYNVYEASPVYVGAGAGGITAGVLYGYIGTSLGTTFIDSNILADLSIVPPVHNNPFPSTGNYPGVVAYFQQRRFYANTKNNPDTYYASQPGAYTNMDSSIPVNDSDAFIGAPWAQQVNGIQFMQPMPSGMIVLTGNGAWLLNGGDSAAITASDQTATPEAYNGCHDRIPPILINYDILYVQSKGSIVRDLSYNFFVNIYTGTDLTVLSNHLFNYHQLEQWAYTEEPFKIVWSARDDGTMLSLTYLKEQDVYGWSRHDTNGFFIGMTSVTEPPVDALYVITQRYINGDWVFYSERMDDRNWKNAEDCFCVDAGLSYPMTFPSSTLTPAAATGTNNITATNLISGGSGYVAPIITAIDPSGRGTGATFSATLTGGVITAITATTSGQNYAAGTRLQILDAAGTGAIAQPIITNNVAFTTSAATFTANNVGDVIRIGSNRPFSGTTGIVTDGGGKAIITSYVDSTHVIANIIEPITGIILNNPENMPVRAISGEWSISTPTEVIRGLNHLEGMEVAILADGSVVPNQTVVNGQITLPQEASAINIGLPYTCQLQTLYMDAPSSDGTIQGKRKNISSVVVRMESSRGAQVGTNQVDQSTTPNDAYVPWTEVTGMKEIKERNNLIDAGNAIPLYTGDKYINVPGGWDTNGQVAIQQVYPLPLNVLATVTQYVVGDTPSR